jgi:hypothetical protein
MHSRISIHPAISEQYERLRRTARHVLRRRRASQAITRLWLWVAMSGTAAVAACGAGAAASAPRPGGRGLPVARLVSIAQGLATRLHDPHVDTAWVIATRRNAAEHATTPGAVRPDPADARAYLIVIRGRFVCRDCTGPSGARPPRGRVAYDIWVPGHGIIDFGLQRRMPRRLGRLGRIVRLELARPAIPAGGLGRS